MTQLYLDDLTPGQQFRSGSHRIDAEDIIAFAKSFDPQPFHTDPVAAADSFFKGLAASGWHTAAITMRLLVDSVQVAGGLIGAGGEVSWPRPTRPGDTLHVVSTIEAVTPSRSRPDRGTARLRSETVNQRGEVAQVLVSTLVVTRRPPSTDPSP